MEMSVTFKKRSLSIEGMSIPHFQHIWLSSYNT